MRTPAAQMMEGIRAVTRHRARRAKQELILEM